MRNWTWALVLTVGALALATSDANAQVFRRGRVYNSYYYPNYAYSYPGYGYGYSAYNYAYPTYGYSGYYGYAPSGVSVYSSPWTGTGVAVNVGRFGFNYGSYPNYGYGWGNYGWRGGRYYYWR